MFLQREKAMCLSIFSCSVCYYFIAVSADGGGGVRLI